MENTFSINLISLLLILGAVQGVFLSILLLTKYRIRPANRFLGLLVLFYSLFILNFMLSNYTALQEKHPHWLMILSGLPFLFGPFHLIYVAELTDTHLKFARVHWYHFLPFILHKLYYLQAYFISSEELSAIMIQIQLNNPPFHIILSDFSVATIGIIYMIIALVVLKRYSRKIQHVYSSLEKLNLSWLRFFTYAAFFIWSVVSVENILTVFSINVSQFFSAVPLLTSVYIYTTGYIGMFKAEIFEQPDVKNNLAQAHEIEERKSIDGKIQRYQKSGLSEQNASSYLKKLISFMEKEKPYLNSELTLNDLSEKLNIPSHNLSEILNTRLNQNFFEFINQYRVNEVRKNLEDPAKDHLTLLSIGLDAGFNSKSGFNAIFKKFMNVTPSEYRQSVRT
ncbi:MAG: helix-turn-helix transcriptional regulator [bacterium]|nr:MAG: helix-turn-helix transcriptional regulator [bacterium]